MHDPDPPPADAPHPLQAAFAAHLPPLLQRPAVARFFGIPQLVAALSGVGDPPRFDGLLQALRVGVRAEGLDHVPRRGPLVVVANHPYAMIDLCCLGACLQARRADARVRAVVDSASDTLIELHPLMVFVGDTPEDRQRFWSEAEAFLADGGALVVFPAGQSGVRDRRGVPIEGPWRAGALKLASRASAELVPAFVHAQTSPRYNLLRRWLPRLLVQKLNVRQVVRAPAEVRIELGERLPVASMTGEALRQAVYSVGGCRFRSHGGQ